MNKISFENYLEKYGSLTYKNTGISMLPLLKQGRDSFTVRSLNKNESCKKWDVVMYKREPNQYVLHRIINVHQESYDILGDNCINIEYNIPKKNIIGVMTDFTHRKKHFTVNNLLYKIYVCIWCKPYYIRIFFKRLVNHFVRKGRGH